MRHLHLVPDSQPEPQEPARPPLRTLARPTLPVARRLLRRLVLARDLAGLTLCQAAAIHRGSVAWLMHVEDGTHELTEHELECFAGVYRCSTDWLLGLVPEQVDRSLLPVMRRPLAPDEEARLLTILALRGTTPKTNGPGLPSGPKGVDKCQHLSLSCPEE